MIEGLWESLRNSSGSAQQRIDANHPLDFYADFQPPDRPGLVLVTSQCPPDRPSIRSISLHVGQRTDSRWAVRLTLEAPALEAVFAELCRDIVDSTRTGVPDASAASALFDRMERWRRLLERGPAHFTEQEARGLIGELGVLLWLVLPEHGPDRSVASWKGPLNHPHDFLLPNGMRIEVKAIAHTAGCVCINGLEQLESCSDPLLLVVVRLEDTAPEAHDAVTLSRIADLVREDIAPSPVAEARFERLLQLTGWEQNQSKNEVAVRIRSLDIHEVDESFPRLVRANVPAGVLAASYTITLPEPSRCWSP